MKNKLLFTLLCCILLFGCNEKSDNSIKIEGTQEEIALSICNDMINENYKDLNKKYDFSDNLEDYAKGTRFEGIIGPSIKALGKYISKEECFTSESAGYSIVNIPTHFENQDVNFVIIFDKNNAIYMINISEYTITSN